MRRRSERKKSTEVNSPAVARRSRRRKSVSVEKNADDFAEEAVSSENQNRGSSEEPLSEKTSRRRRNSHKRTPVNEYGQGTPSKRGKIRRSESPDIRKIDEIPEEENGGIEKTSTQSATEAHGFENDLPDNQVSIGGDHVNKGDTVQRETPEQYPCKEEMPRSTNEEDETRKTEEAAEEEEPMNEDESEKEVIGNSRSLSPKAMVEEKSKTSDVLDIKEDSQEVGHYVAEKGDVEIRSFASITYEKSECNNLDNVHKPDEKEAAGQIRTDILAETNRTANDYNDKIQQLERSQKEHAEIDPKERNVIKMGTIPVESKELDSASGNHEDKRPQPQEETVRTRKRKWLTKRSESKAPIMAISTDSLKGFFSDVQPVPLSDVHLDTSPEMEVLSEREEGEETPTPERIEEHQSDSAEKVLEKPALKRIQKEPIVTIPMITVTAAASAAAATATAASVVPNVIVRSPSPPRNKTSNVLYITNLVRPFTVLQLKGLLARTGKIVEEGFWIDRIKSKCYVEYETEDEAIETRHALHGVRWPVSNPKCLNVDFGSKADMERAIYSTKEEGPKLGQDNKDNIIVGTGWNHGERNDDIDRKTTRPVREWDVGKKENLDRGERRRSRERERDRGRDRDRERERNLSANRENDRVNDRRARIRGRERSESMSPERKVLKKENEPPLRLLDDLFRKTKSTPCVYWLPLTPEQIAEKEAHRQKRILEHQERVKQREQERETEREKDRNRGSDRDRERDRDRRRSSDRRRSRSRDRRRY